MLGAISTVADAPESAMLSAVKPPPFCAASPVRRSSSILVRKPGTSFELDREIGEDRVGALASGRRRSAPPRAASCRSRRRSRRASPRCAGRRVQARDRDKRGSQKKSPCQHLSFPEDQLSPESAAPRAALRIERFKSSRRPPRASRGRGASAAMSDRSRRPRSAPGSAAAPQARNRRSASCRRR